MSTTIVSAPGKVLIAGGYLVLEPEHTGVVVSTSARFYTVIEPVSDAAIVVRAPQFDGASWTYQVDTNGGRLSQRYVLTQKTKESMLIRRS